MRNDWYKNGELPPVGSKLIFKCDDAGLGRNKDFNNQEITVLGVFKIDKDYCIAFSSGLYGIGCSIYKKKWLTPIKSDREKAIEEMIDIANAAYEENHGRNFPIIYDITIAALYDAGYRKAGDK